MSVSEFVSVEAGITNTAANSVVVWSVDGNPVVIFTGKLRQCEDMVNMIQATLATWPGWERPAQ